MEEIIFENSMKIWEKCKSEKVNIKEQLELSPFEIERYFSKYETGQSNYIDLIRPLLQFKLKISQQDSTNVVWLGMEMYAHKEEWIG